MADYAKFRKGFTLIELLVVMALIAVLATFAIMFFPNAASAQRESRAATQVQGWLNIAKQRALRDQKPHGIRLWIHPPDGSLYNTQRAWTAGTAYVVFDSVVVGGVAYRCRANHTATPVNQPNLPGGAGFWTSTQLVTDCQFIEQPDDFPGASGITIQNALPPVVPGGGPPAVYRNNPLTVLFINADLLNGLAPATLSGAGAQPIANPDVKAKFWLIQPDDYLEVLGNGQMHRIIQIGVPTAPPFTSTASPVPGAQNDRFIVVSPPLPTALGATTNWRIVRAPRVIGDETLKMPEATLIDLDTNTIFNSQLPTNNPFNDPAQSVGAGYVDILFAPNGSVISRGVTTDKIHLWVRSPSEDNNQAGNVFRGDPTLVTVFVRTGFVGAFAPDPNLPANNPYTFVK
jgi:prepilin-type N-terminal cleavage/methylation domain-containing protein